MTEDKRTIVITAKVSRKTYYLFRDLCRAHGVPVYQGIEEALDASLERAGVAAVAGESEVAKG